jgi:hypothetical protein
LDATKQKKKSSATTMQAAHGMCVSMSNQSMLDRSVVDYSCSTCEVFYGGQQVNAGTQLQRFSTLFIGFRSWEDIREPKNQGGLGIRDMELIKKTCLSIQLGMSLLTKILFFPIF